MTVYHEAGGTSVQFCTYITRHFAADLIMGIKSDFLLPAVGSSNGLLLLLTVNVVQQNERYIWRIETEYYFDWWSC